MKEAAIFELSFDGEAVKDGSIEVNDLAPALLALGDLIDEANKCVTDGKASVTLRVRPDIERGSFNITLEVAQRWYETFVDIFTSRDVTALNVLLSVIGISGAFGLIQLIKKSKGKKPKTVVEIKQSTKVRVEFEGEKPIETEKKVIDMYANSRARDALARFAKPLQGKGIDELMFSYKDRPSVKIVQNEADYFCAPDLGEEETASETESILKIIAVSFKEGDKWRFWDGSTINYFSLLDKDFIDKVHRNEVRFGENDHLRVILRTRQRYEAGELKTARDILKVIKHIPSGKQALISFENSEKPDENKKHR